MHLNNFSYLLMLYSQGLSNNCKLSRAFDNFYKLQIAASHSKYKKH